MASKRFWIGSLLVQIQEAFLETPDLELTLSVAKQRFDVDTATCEEVLGVLADAGVLTRTAAGTYTRHVPRRSGRRAATAVTAQRRTDRRPRRLSQPAA
jgi:hypothetical protein